MDGHPNDTNKHTKNIKKEKKSEKNENEVSVEMSCDLMGWNRMR